MIYKRLICILLLCGHFFAFADESREMLQAQLQEADELKNMEPVQFNALIAELNEKQTLMSPEQRDLLSLLTVYQVAMGGDYAAAEPEVRKLGRLAHDPLIRFRSRYALVYILAVQKKWVEALEESNAVIAEAPAIDQIEHRQNAYLAVVTLYNQLKQYDLALRYIKLMEKQVLPPKSDCVVGQLELEALYRRSSLEELAPKFDGAIALCEKASVAIALNLIRMYKTEKLLTLKDGPAATAYLNPHLAEIEGTRYPLLIAKAHNLMAESFLLQGDLQNAERHLGEALGMIELASPLVAVDTYRLQYELHERRGRFVEALAAYKRYAETERANLDELAVKEVAFQTVKRQAEQQRSEMQLRAREAELQNRTQALDKQEAMSFRLISAVFACFAGLVAVLAYRLWRIKKRLKALNEYDHLTGVYNRRHFTELAQEALKLCVVKGEKVACVLLELDHLKKMNDEHGYAAGDWVLKRVADVLSGTIRGNDIFARLAGEEFVILLPGCDVNNALRVVEKCRTAIAHIDTERTGHRFTISASFGVTDTDRSGYKLDQLFSDADCAVGEAKERGRNLATVFAPA